MTTTFFIPTDSVKYLYQEMPNRMTILGEDNDKTLVEVYIKDGLDILSIYLAGYSAGSDKAKSVILKTLSL